MARFEGRTAIVTGAAFGERASLGAAFAQGLAAEGAKVVVADVQDASAVAARIHEDGGTAMALKVDVSDAGQVAELMDKTCCAFGTPDILVNNAGLGSNMPPVSIEEIAVDDWDRLFAVNVRGMFLCIQAVAPLMRQAGYGKIVNLGSTTMMTGKTHRLHYVTAKGAVLAMTRAAAAELGPSGIRVNCAAFGLVSSQITDTQFAENPDLKEQILSARAIPHEYRPEDLTGTILYLASSDSDHMTGQCLVVNNGEFFY